MDINLRPVDSSDESFLFELYASTRELEMSQVPWNKAQKQAFMEMQFRAQSQSYAATHPHAAHLLLSEGAHPVGRLYIDRAGDRFHILDITIAPACRNRGIGSRVLLEILKEASENKRPVSIYVENFNPSVRLFARLGFRPVREQGFQLLLEWTTAASA